MMNARQVADWGYELPATVAKVVQKQTASGSSATVRVLDLGCGDGLVGVELRKVSTLCVVAMGVANDVGLVWFGWFGET